MKGISMFKIICYFLIMVGVLTFGVMTERCFPTYGSDNHNSSSKLLKFFGSAACENYNDNLCKQEEYCADPYINRYSTYNMWSAGVPAIEVTVDCAKSVTYWNNNLHMIGLVWQIRMKDFELTFAHSCNGTEDVFIEAAERDLWAHRHCLNHILCCENEAIRLVMYVDSWWAYHTMCQYLDADSINSEHVRKGLQGISKIITASLHWYDLYTTITDADLKADCMRILSQADYSNIENTTLSLVEIRKTQVRRALVTKRMQLGSTTERTVAMSASNRITESNGKGTLPLVAGTLIMLLVRNRM